MKKYFLFLAILSCLLVVYPALGEQSSELWQDYELESATHLSRILDRPLMILFFSEGCPGCKAFKTTLDHSDVGELLGKHFVVSLIRYHPIYEINLPVEGKMTNRQLFHEFEVRFVPTTLFFHPPRPALIGGDGKIERLDGYYEPKEMIEILETLLTDLVKTDQNLDQDEPIYYNYQTPIKAINEEQLQFLREVGIDFSVVTEKVEPSSLPKGPELIVNLTDEDGKKYARKILSETQVRKVYLLEDG